MRKKCKVGQILIAILLLIFIVTLALAFLLMGKKSINVYAYSEVEENSNIIEHEFENDSVLVVLDEKISAVNKVHNKKFFGDVEIEKIIDLTEKDTNQKIQTDSFRQILQIVLENGTKEKVLKAVQELKQIDGIISAEPNYIFQVEEEPNDTYYVDGSMWGLNGVNGINMPSAWDIAKGSSNVRVGVIDTGIANHSDLNANLTTGRDTFHDNDTTTDDTHSHGTHVAGTIGAVGNNSIGVVGVNHNVTLVPLQAANESNKFNSVHVIKAIEWATKKWGTSEQIDILNYSVEGLGKSTSLSILETISKYPGLFVWCAGNSGKNLDNYADINKFKLPNLISVGALTSEEERASYSNFGKESVDIYAPGSGILSTTPKELCTGAKVQTKNGVRLQCECIWSNEYNTTGTWEWVQVSTHKAQGYHYKNGTSMAAPHVTGVAALLLSVDPSLTARQLKSIILKSADDIKIAVHTDSGSIATQWVEKLNAYRAVDFVDRENFSEEIDLYTNGGIGDNVLEVWNRQPMPELEMPVRAGYKFNGYYSSDGTQFYDSNMNSVRNWSIMYDSALYAEWTPVDTGESGDDSCIASGSLITLADGTTKPVEALNGDESLLVWDFKTGSFASAPILFIDVDEESSYQIINVSFSDGTAVKVIYEHAFWDCNLNEYVFLREDAAQYLGHWFNKQTTDENGDLTWTSAQLTDVTVTQEYTVAYSPVTYGHLCYYVNGMLSMPGATEGFINIFEVDAYTMTYDQEAFENDVETYGLYTYEEFNELVCVSEEVFNAFNGQYLKISIGKGMITLEEIENLLNRYSELLN